MRTILLALAVCLSACAVTSREGPTDRQDAWPESVLASAAADPDSDGAPDSGSEAEAGEAAGGSSAEAMARKLQNPLANIKALMTDNDINFKTGDDDEVSYGFQLQPVYAVPFEDSGFTLVNRALIPILGVPAGGQRPILDDPVPSDSGGRTWGLSDIVLQFFFAPDVDSKWKWGVGPTFSLKTRTKDELGGAGWGAGPIAVLVGSLSKDTSLAVIGGHIWGDEDGFSTTSLFPMVFYNIPKSGGWTIHYMNTITYNWNADRSGDAWTVPLGLGVSKMFDLSGTGMEVVLGYYYNVAKPEGAADSAIKWSVNFVF